MFVGISLILLSLLSSHSATVASLFVGLNIARPIDAVTKSRPARPGFLVVRGHFLQLCKALFNTDDCFDVGVLLVLLSRPFLRLYL